MDVCGIFKRFGDAIQRGECSRQISDEEDIEFGKCLQTLGVKAMDSRDGDSKDTFFPFAPDFHLKPGGIPEENWFWKYILYPNPTVSYQYLSRFKKKMF